MDHFLERLEQSGNVKDLLRQSCKKNRLNTALGGDLTISKLRLLNEKFKKAYSLPNTAIHIRVKTSWIENELKAFNWILIAISALENVTISEFVSQYRYRTSVIGVYCKKFSSTKLKTSSSSKPGDFYSKRERGTKIGVRTKTGYC